MKKKMNIIFEKLKEEDLETIATLYDLERPINTNREKMCQTFNKIKNNPDYYIIVAKLNKEVVGIANIFIHQDIFEENNPFMTIWSVRIKKEYRKQGIGRKLFQYIEKIANEINCEFICLITEKNNKGANAFYQKLGYKCENGYIKMLN